MNSRRLLEDPLAHLRTSPVISHPRGSTIYSSGDSADKIYLIISGRVKVSCKDKSGREIVLHLYHADDLFGEAAFIERFRSEKASALEDTQVMAWTIDQIKEAGSLNESLYFALMQMSAVRARSLEVRLSQMVTQDVLERLARALLELTWERRYQADPVGITPITQEVLGSYIGTSREAVALGLNKLRRAGLIEYSRKNFSVHRERLQGFICKSSERVLNSRAAS